MSWGLEKEAGVDHSKKWREGMGKGPGAGSSLGILKHVTGSVCWSPELGDQEVKLRCWPGINDGRPMYQVKGLGAH